METMPRCYISEGDAHDALRKIEPGSVRLASFSPAYLDVVDYEKAADEESNEVAWANLANDAKRKRRRKGRPRADRMKTRDVNEKVAVYVGEHLETCRLLASVTAPEATVCVEVDDYRVDGEWRLVHLTDLWCRMLEAAGFTIAEKITLGRKIAVSRRGAYLMREDGAYSRPGYFAPANVTSTLLVAMKGDVQARLRRDGSDSDGFDRGWASRYIKSLWMLKPPVVTGRRRDRTGHPCPQDLDVARAIVRFYSVQSDLVLDPFAGSGTTGIAAVSEGRSAALIEREGYFCSLMRERMETIRGVTIEQLGKKHRLIVPGAQLFLPLVPPELRGQIDAAAYGGNGAPTTRHKEMARAISEMIDLHVPASLVSVFLRGERAHYARD